MIIDEATEGRSFEPGKTLLGCNGQDISRKKTKGKSRILTILPAQFAVRHSSEGQIGTLENANTNLPEFVVEIDEVDLFFNCRVLYSPN